MMKQQRRNMTRDITKRYIQQEHMDSGLVSLQEVYEQFNERCKLFELTIKQHALCRTESDKPRQTITRVFLMLDQRYRLPSTNLFTFLEPDGLKIKPVKVEPIRHWQSHLRQYIASHDSLNPKTVLIATTMTLQEIIKPGRIKSFAI